MQPSSRTVPLYAWAVVAMLFPVALLNYLDRMMVATMRNSIRADIPSIASDADFGFLMASFMWVYALLSPVGGFFADRFQRRWVIILSLLIWSATTWLTGFATTFAQMACARAFMGISEAFYIPAALALIADFHPAATRSRAIGIHQMGIYCGVIIGGFSGYVADSPQFGWRWAFDACGIFGMVYAVPLLWKLRNAPRIASHERAVISPTKALAALLTNGSFILLVLCFTLPALAAWIVRDWMPAILKTEFGIGQGRAGVSATFFWQFAAIIGALFGGWIADRWIRRTRRARIYVSAMGIVLIIPAMFGLGFAPRTGLLWVAILFLLLFGLGWGFFDCNNMPILCQIARPELRATGYGLMNLVSISAGGMADWGFGILRDRHVPLASIFGIFSSAALVSVALVLLIKPRETAQ
jgi:MFS family permease